MASMLTKISKNKHALIFIGGVALTFLGYFQLLNSGYLNKFVAFSQENIVLYFVVLVCLKILGIVWPPIPGGLLTLGSIPILGWFYAWLADCIGSLIGSSIAYYLGRKYGMSFLKKIFDEATLSKIGLIKMNPKREIEGVAVLRLFYGTISEVISYGSGLIGVKYPSFLLGTLLALLSGSVFFYVANSIFTGANVALNGALIVLAILLFFRLKGRYFE